MPPVTKYSKERIIEIALNIVRDDGIESVSARNIAKKLGCSICPVFSCFENMDVLKKEVLDKIYGLYTEYIQENMKKESKPFKGAGMGYIKFAKENKKFFKALFMMKLGGNITELLKSDINNDKISKAISKYSGLSEEDSRKLHEYCWVFVHGIAVMIATDYCNFSDEEISKMLTLEYISLLEGFKKENIG